MKKALFITSLLALVLSACSSSNPTEVAADLKRKQEQLEYEAQTEYMKATRKAVFKEEALYQDNCKVGELQWVSESGWRQEIKAVICDGLPTSSLQYREGKVTKSVLSVGETVDEVTAAKKILEEEEKKIKEKKKAEALSKLSDEDKKSLGL